MPNWCENTLTLTHEDVGKIDALEAELMSDAPQIFNHLRPNPTGEWQYDWSVDNWGTKWDADLQDWDRDGNSITFYGMNTAWGPPIALYDYLTENGWVVEAMYHEPGMQFCGMYASEDGDDYYEYSFDDFEGTVNEDMPEELKEWAGLVASYQEWLADGEDIENEI
jgi:hypothetical protein